MAAVRVASMEMMYSAAYRSAPMVVLVVALQTCAVAVPHFPIGSSSVVAAVVAVTMASGPAAKLLDLVAMVEPVAAPLAELVPQA